ncbi:MAG: inositol monophosphatase, partial [Deltaproteobacteria bacterium]|nr:inositol monophosphatase [Deltaproteobacteria bacterium]
MQPWDEILETALTSAKAAGEILSTAWQGPKQVRYKGDINLVTEFDLAAEKAIVTLISRTFPDHIIVAEEGGQTNTSSPYRWYIDPLDGTTNFAHGFPVFAVSIAFEAPGPNGPEVKVGVIFDPLRQEMYQAVKGQGAYLNHHPLKVSRETDLDHALLATGFPYDLRLNPEPVMSRFRAISLAVQGVRRAGSAALDLAWLAAGRFDGFWEEKLHPWDTAAGTLLVLEAGGRVTDFSDRPYVPTGQEILATNGLLHYNII